MKIEVDFSGQLGCVTALDPEARSWCSEYKRPGVTLYPSQIRKGRYQIRAKSELTDFLGDFLAAGGTLCEPEHD